MNDYYQVLEVETNASQDRIQNQYRFLVQAWHPDKFGSPESKAKAEEKLKQINEAYNVLKDPIKRQQYDHQRQYSQKRYSTNAQTDDRERQKYEREAKVRAEAERQQREQDDARKREQEAREKAEAERRVNDQVAQSIVIIKNLFDAINFPKFVGVFVVIVTLFFISLWMFPKFISLILTPKIIPTQSLAVPIISTNSSVVSTRVCYALLGMINCGYEPKTIPE